MSVQSPSRRSNLSSSRLSRYYDQSARHTASSRSAWVTSQKGDKHSHPTLPLRLGVGVSQQYGLHGRPKHTTLARAEGNRRVSTLRTVLSAGASPALLYGALGEIVNSGANVSSHHGPVGSPSRTGQTRRNPVTRRPAWIAAASARNPSARSPWNLTVGWAYACSGPPWQDSNVSTPASNSRCTAIAMPGSSGGENSLLTSDTYDTDVFLLRTIPYRGRVISLMSAGDLPDGVAS